MAHDIRTARSAEDFVALEALIRRYAAEIKVDLCFQGFDQEIADLRGFYETALLGGPADNPLGCVALKRHSAERCEMKRLYVRPDARGTGLGERLAEAIVAEARMRAYREMVLDSFEWMTRAFALYGRMGFTRCAPYYASTQAGVIAMRLAL